MGHEIKKILITDNEDSILTSLSCALQKNMMEVTSCHEFEQVIDALVADSYDVLIADIGMPGSRVFKSLELLGFIKRHFCTEVIVMSNYNWRESEAELCRLHGLNYLNKPLNIQDVLTICESTHTR